LFSRKKQIIPGINFQRCTDMILTKERKKKLKTFLEFPNAGCMYEVLKTAKYKTIIKTNSTKTYKKI